MVFRIFQAPNVRSLLVLAVTAALMWTLHVTYNSHNYIFIPTTATTSIMKDAGIYGPTLTNTTRKVKEVTYVPRVIRNNTRTQEATNTPTNVSTARTDNKKPLPMGARGNVPIPFLQVTLPATSQTLHKSLSETNSTHRTANANFTNMSSQTLTETNLKREPSQQPASEPQATASAKNLTVIQRDYSRKPSVLWPQDANCSSYKLWFGLRVPSAWLLSFPRSGNTWTRYLLEGAAGVVTGSVYHSKYLKGLGYMGEDDPLWWRTSLVIKTHSLLPLRIHPDYPVIAVIRNPARSILSFWNYWNIEAESQKFTGSIDYSYYSTPEFHEFVHIKLQKWRATYEYVLKNTTKLHVVFYERLRENPIKEVRKILTFLGVKPDEGRLACLSRHTEGRVKGAQKENDPYSLYEKMNMFSVVQAINALLKERGFTDLPDYEF
ncbi:WSC domain-containing protein 2-like isoform X2 [Penaeus chinensis]|uniref:WSC domain-containing protein 2-like isoform X2 n=1 Tax=Penaeus chinensis TaxID=139456 RepID=UPI001FB6C733|nr:WSC domain-containing protein 2-like isoform X2 [Penaeus chinensis]